MADSPQGRMPLSGRRLLTLGLGVVAVSALIAVLRVELGVADAKPSTEKKTEAPAPKGRVTPWMKPSALKRVQADDSGTYVKLGAGRKATLTLDAKLQDHVETIFERYEVPFASLVAIEPSTGRVLAYVSHASANPSAGDLARDTTPPAASVFKIVTTTALLEAGVPRNEKVCFHGGLSRLDADDLVDDPKRDKSCATLEEALAMSTNAVFAKLAVRHLNPAVLTKTAKRFGFGRKVPFDFPWNPSGIALPGEKLEFARSAAGFWHTHLSPLHAATMVAAVANKGVMRPPFLVADIKTAKGKRIYSFKPEAARRVMSPDTAKTVGAMMEGTCRYGTARKAFYDRKKRPFLPNIEVAGKTGTLSTQQPYRGYTWWAGFAPLEAPRIAVAALVVNTPKWRIKAPYVAREALRNYLRR